jgi:UDP-glucuronate decarboxylase
VRQTDSGESPTGPVNLGNPVEFTMLDLAQSILREAGSDSELAFHPVPQHDPRHPCPLITLASPALRWQPATALNDGLARTVDCFHTRLQPEA